MVDNYDSFTFNLVHYLQKIEIPLVDVQVIVRRNDQLTLSQIEALNLSHIIISPGPGNPDCAGLTLNVIEHFHGQLPMLGVCLGHQAIGQYFGGQVVKAPVVMHGKVSFIYHNSQGIFRGIPQGFKATRYHSLVLASRALPDCLEMTAWTQDENGAVDVIMGVRHREFSVEGVQFHPESVLSESGIALLEQFLTA